MRRFDYTVPTAKSVDEAVAAIETKTVEKSFRVLHIHDVAGLLTEKGFPRAPLKIIEICQAKSASAVLDKDIRTSLMLPCPISVYVKDGQTYISTFLPSAMVEFFPDANIAGEAAAVERGVLEIIAEAR